MSETLRGLINTWALQTVAMALTALALPKLRITGILGAFGTVAALALVNTTIWDAGLFASLPGSFSVQALQLLGAKLSVLISTYASDVDVIDSVKSIFGFVEETRDHLMVEDPAPE
jgi:hypothetical protein